MDPEEAQKMFEKELGELDDNDREVLDSNKRFHKGIQKLAELTGTSID